MEKCRSLVEAYKANEANKANEVIDENDQEEAVEDLNGEEDLNRRRPKGTSPDVLENFKKHKIIMIQEI